MKGYYNKCIICGRTFQTVGSGAFTKKTCSDECWIRYKGGKYKKLYKFTCRPISQKVRKRRCIVCGKFFFVSGSGSGSRKVCSKDCRDKRNRQLRDSYYKRNPLSKYEEVTRGCVKKYSDEYLVDRLNKAEIRLGIICVLIEKRGLVVRFDGAKYVLVKKKV